MRGKSSPHVGNESEVLAVGIWHSCGNLTWLWEFGTAGGMWHGWGDVARLQHGSRIE